MSVKDGAIIALLALCVGLVARGQQVIDHRNALKTENKQLRSDRDHLIEQYRLTEEAYHALSETKLQIDAQTKTVIKRIHAAPKRDDAPLAPVLKDTLEVIE